MHQEQAVERFTVPIGPQHPALKEPANFLISVEGEIVTRAVVRLGYAHRGIEKAAESQENLMPLIINCVESYATLGEIADTLRNVFGTHYEGDF